MDDKLLWNKAKARVRFKNHLLIYFLVNLLLWCIWIFTNLSDGKEHWSFPWPIYPLLIWSIGTTFDWYNSYCRTTEERTRDEYEKLKDKSDR